VHRLCLPPLPLNVCARTSYGVLGFLAYVCLLSQASGFRVIGFMSTENFVVQEGGDGVFN
jgi:hypothetical protein